MLGNGSGRIVKGLSLGKLRQGRFVLGFLVGLSFQRQTETGVNAFPASSQNCFAFCGKLFAAALKYSGDSFIHMGRRNGAKQLAADKGQQFLFAFCQPGKSRLCKLRCRQDRMMVCHLGIIDNAPDLRGELCALHKGQHGQKCRNKVNRRLLHVGSDIIAVRSRIGQKTLFIQGLGIVKGLLGSKSVGAVGFPLQGSKVIELRGLGCLFLLCQRNANGLRFLACRFQPIGGGSVGDPFALGVCAAAADMHGMVFLFLESKDFALALHQQIQRRGKYAPHIQRLMVQDREKAGGIDAHKPVCPRSAECRMIQRVIVAPVFECVHALADRAVLHRGNPKTLERFTAISLFIDKSEDQLTLAPCVTGIYQLVHISAVHKLFENGKLIFLTGGQRVLPFLRQNRKILISPLFITLVIAACVAHAHQMSHAPRYQNIVSGNVSVLLLLCTQSRSNGLCHRGLFTDNQFHASVSSLSSGSSSS